MSIKEGLTELAQNPKVGTAVSAATTGTGLGTFLDWIPDDIGKLATLVGMALSIILIRVHLLSVKKAKLEIMILKEKEAERIEAALKRKEAGEPARKKEDNEV